MVQRTRLIPILIVLPWLLWGIAGCGTSNNNTNPATQVPPTQTPHIQSTHFPATESEVRRLQSQYELLSTAHNSMTRIWETLAAEGTVRCGELPLAPRPEDIYGETLTDAVTTLQDAAVEINRSMDLWANECSQPRAMTPPDIIEEGIQTGRVAQRQLEFANDLLTQAMTSP